jgi:RNA polymerase sigma factor (sigma-70 family)
MSYNQEQRDDLLDRLLTVRGCKPAKGPDGFAGDPQFVAAAWDVVLANTGLIHHTLKKGRVARFEPWYDDAVSHLTTVLFECCATYKRRTGTFATHAVSNMGYQLKWFRQFRWRQTLPYSLPQGLTPNQIKKSMADVKEKMRAAKYGERPYHPLARVTSLAHADMAYRMRQVDHGRPRRGEAGEQTEGSTDPLQYAPDGGDLATPQDDPVFEQASSNTVALTVRAALATHLTPRQRRVMELRYGFVGEGPLTLEAIALTEGVSRELIRKIERQALGKLRQAAETLPHDRDAVGFRPDKISRNGKLAEQFLGGVAKPSQDWIVPRRRVERPDDSESWWARTDPARFQSAIAAMRVRLTHEMKVSLVPAQRPAKAWEPHDFIRGDSGEGRYPAAQCYVCTGSQKIHEMEPSC